jgi:hypothetical protein
MANRKPFKLEATIRIYNVFQILSCANIIYQVSTECKGYVHIKYLV